MPHGRLLVPGFVDFVCEWVAGELFDRSAGGADQPGFRFRGRAVGWSSTPRKTTTPIRTMAAVVMVLSSATTPGDYHRIISPTLTIPTDVTKPIPVGLLSCQRQPVTPTF